MPPSFTSAERNAEDYAFARDLGLPISVHVGMAGTADAVTTLQRYRLLGADVNYVHGNMLTDREFDLIAETQGTVTITPSTDMLMQFGTFPATGPALSRGIVSGFGIDTICSAGNCAARSRSPPAAAVTHRRCCSRRPVNSSRSTRGWRARRTWTRSLPRHSPAAWLWAAGCARSPRRRVWRRLRRGRLAGPICCWMASPW